MADYKLLLISPNAWSAKYCDFFLWWCMFQKHSSDLLHHIRNLLKVLFPLSSTRPKFASVFHCNLMVLVGQPRLGLITSIYLDNHLLAAFVSDQAVRFSSTRLLLRAAGAESFNACILSWRRGWVCVSRLQLTASSEFPATSLRLLLCLPFMRDK